MVGSVLLAENKATRAVLADHMLPYTSLPSRADTKNRSRAALRETATRRLIDASEINAAEESLFACFFPTELMLEHLIWRRVLVPLSSSQVL